MKALILNPKQAYTAFKKNGSSRRQRKLSTAKFKFNIKR